MSNVKSSVKRSNRYKGLKPFKKGQTGNPKGYSKKAKINKIFKDIVTQGDKDEIYEKIIAKAKIGKEFFVNTFLERVEGKVPHKTELTGKGGGAVEINFTTNDAATKKKFADLRKKLSE